MKKNILFLIPAFFFILNGCKKDGNNNNNTPPVVPGISIQTITYPSFANSPWINVIGGTALLQFDLLGSGGAVSSTIKDSNNLQSITSYNKTLTKGIYNIYISSKNQSAAADTFIRFNAQLKAYDVSSQQALSFTATSTDELITIGQSFVQGNTVPTFKTDTGTKAYKFGLSNGFYYLYVTGGLKGSVSFVSKTGNQTFTKSLSIVALTQYNMALQTVNGSLQVVFVPFVYNQVALGSSTLATVDISVPGFIANGTTIYFVATDENGNVLNEVKYIPGTTVFKIASLKPFLENRFNLFEIIISPVGSNSVPQITGYLQVKKGSTFNGPIAAMPTKAQSPLKVHLTNTSGFDLLQVSTNYYAGTTLHSLSDSTNLQTLYYPDSSKLWVQILKNNQYSYNFFNIPKGTLNLNVDLTQLTKAPLIKTFTSPGTNLSAEVFAITDNNYFNFYDFGVNNSGSNQLSYYYPSEFFPLYTTRTNFSTGSFYYSNYSTGTSIVNQVEPINASIAIKGTNLTNFVPGFSGTFDYYFANFISAIGTKPYIEISLFSPSAANFTNIKLPDFSQYLGVTSLDLSAQVLTAFQLIQVSSFNESNFPYPAPSIINPNNYSFKSVEQDINLK
jgi:hypothetical protein